jgi:ribose 5-phosphate isomerase B
LNKKIVVGSDHGGFELKEKIKKYLDERGYAVTDTGAFNTDSVDYPDFALAACKEFLSKDYDLGILFCGTGIGISIAANKIHGIRCALPNDLFTAEMCKAHNNANFIAFGGRVKYQIPIEEMIDKFIATNFEGGGRHEKRVQKIAALEKSECSKGL